MVKKHTPLNPYMLKILNAHLPQPGLSPGANYDRLKRLLQEVLPAQLEGIRKGHGFSLDSVDGAGATGTGDLTDPNRGMP